MKAPPSIYAHTLGGGMLLLALALAIVNFSDIQKLAPNKLITIILLGSIAMSIHGISHIGLESVYQYNPLNMFKTNL